ncbi:MAG TPA: alpha/beta hydrolase domain-containing protein [Blastocatellia bacterium]|nr:alpha/beta hydrolase domain-containing protein [Blastocatellia bacterium]
MTKYCFHRVAGVVVTLLISLACSTQVQARVTKILIEEKQSPTSGGKSFGSVGQYEMLTGKAFGELDPKDPHNAIITDIQFAPRNSRGMVEYVATFMMLKPVDLTKTNGVLLYAVPNRGNRILSGGFSVAGESGEEFLMKRGYVILFSGWQGDLVPRAGTETISVPIAKNPDGSSITGTVLARFSNMPSGTKTLPLPVAHTAASLDTTKATLTRRASEEGAIIPLASSEWAFADCSKSAFPGASDANKLCLKNGFDPAYLYELAYTAKDPLVLGIGFAATRDITSFFRRSATDDAGTANPISGRITHAIAQGNSQSGNFIKTFVSLGFNQDEANRIVWEGANDHIAGRQMALNIRFAHPGGAANLYEPGSEAILWWGKYEDSARDRKSASMLDRCSLTRTCPRIFETFGSAEFWGLRMSPNLVGTKADVDIPLPANVRRYYFPGTTHGGGRGGFNTEVTPATASATSGVGACELPNNNNPQADTMRALFVALTDWVVKDIAPPPSQYPRLDKNQLVWPRASAMGFPTIPGMPLPDNLLNTFLDYDFGTEFNYNDLSGVLATQPPIIKRVLPLLVPKVDADGNETSGIASPLHQAPLGTYLGWNVTRSGFYKGRVCGFSGGFIPFAKTKAERESVGDPRLSLEERYRDHAGYVAAVKTAVDRLLKQKFLLTEDAERLIREAEASNVLR